MDNQDNAPTVEPSTEFSQLVEDVGQSADECILKLDESHMDCVGEMLDHCIQQVSCLEMQREELIQEFLFLQEPMMRVVDHLREKLVEKRRLLNLAQLDHVDVLEEVQQVKRKLFNTARDCIHCQVTLAEQKYQVAQAALTEEELKAQVQCLTEELLQLQESHQNRLNSLRDQAKKPCRPRAMSDVSLCRQASVRLQRRLSVSIQELERWYEPRLIALLKRRQFGEKALRISSEQALSFKAKLEPLKWEVQRLEEQRSCLEQRINLMQQEREEMITQHKEAEEELKQELGNLVLDIEIKKRHKKDLEALTNDILEEMAYLRVCNEATANEQAEGSTSCQPI
ncbi:syncoilin-like [Corythoichthys intestinalis]|uniref:syncoilin-like n=1 Tax=Corythoichthys intestinalis TaxID=161448 RepID=UPI0025A569C0|nr:syncoilin-like [Corythoichthys intestinalis]XP_061798686.1 syncoilin-like [Nerophis lumbriciformis]